MWNEMNINPQIWRKSQRNVWFIKEGKEWRKTTHRKLFKGHTYQLHLPWEKYELFYRNSIASTNIPYALKDELQFACEIL